MKWDTSSVYRPRPLFQKTLKNKIKCNGVGLHSGARVAMILHPAEPNSGVVFCRVDLPGKPRIQASYDRVTDVRLCTTLGDGAGAIAGTVEHLMAAFAGLGVDNVLVELDGPEVPAMDGSSAPFVFLLECADLVELPALRSYIEVLKPVVIEEQARSVSLSPADGFMVSFSISFDNPLVGDQYCDFELVDGSFKGELARARTFGFVEEVDRLRAMGLALGGSLDNAVVVNGTRVLNQDGLRYDDEFVRHKALDALGDLYLAGAPILGHFRGDRAGHALNNRLLRQLFADQSAWRRVNATPAAMAIHPTRRRARHGVEVATAVGS
jgi:UDP-3-O-[3-hydroxymyristoyl] N-acetylglucosamine deacetylase